MHQIGGITIKYTDNSCHMISLFFALCFKYKIKRFKLTNIYVATPDAFFTKLIEYELLLRDIETLIVKIHHDAISSLIRFLETLTTLKHLSIYSIFRYYCFNCYIDMKYLFSVIPNVTVLKIPAENIGLDDLEALKSLKSLDVLILLFVGYSHKKLKTKAMHIPVEVCGECLVFKNILTCGISNKTLEMALRIPVFITEIQSFYEDF